MNTHEDKHLLEYIILLIGLVVFFIAFYLVKGTPQLQLFVGFGGSLFYVLWGIIHHAVEGRLNKSIVLEYILIGLFIFSLLSIVLIY